jgi:hypothetical protein
MIWFKTVGTQVTRGYTAKRGTADNAIVPAADGSTPHFIVLAEGQSDVGTTIAVGLEAAILVGGAGSRDYPAQAGAAIQAGQFLMATTNGSLVPVTNGNYYCAQALNDAASGAIVRVHPCQGRFTS